MEKLIGYYPGAWDLLHYGHIIAINKAKHLCKTLIIGVAEDKLVNKKHRLIMNAKEREFALKQVFEKNVYIFKNHLYKTHCYFDIFFCGPEFGEFDYQKGVLEDLIKNGKIIITINRTPNISTSLIIDKIQRIL